MRHLLRAILNLILLAVVIFAIFIGVMWSREWKPDAVEVKLSRDFWGESGADTLRVGDTITIVSWNVGYAGLGDDMDFFMDGGKKTRTTRERTEENLREIIDFLASYAGVADFILLQEVDFAAGRSYGINEYDSIRQGLGRGGGYYGWWGLNYKSGFVPVPVTSPMGSVKSGVVILSKWKPAEVVRLQYPGEFSFPVRLFHLKRCMLSASIPVSEEDGRGGRRQRGMLYVNNTHNSAFDKSGEMRRVELEFIRGYLAGKSYSVTLGDWNSTPPGYRASEAALTDNYFTPYAIRREDFPPEMNFVYDPTIPSVRYGYEPYDPHKTPPTTTTVVDFALSGPKMEPVSFATIDLGFGSSDHNPIVARFLIR